MVPFNVAWARILNHPELWTTDDTVVAELITKFNRFNHFRGELGVTEHAELRRHEAELCRHLKKAYNEAQLDRWDALAVLDILSKLEGQDSNALALRELLETVKFIPETPPALSPDAGIVGLGMETEVDDGVSGALFDFDYHLLNTGQPLQFDGTAAATIPTGQFLENHSHPPGAATFDTQIQQETHDTTLESNYSMADPSAIPFTLSDPTFPSSYAALLQGGSSPQQDSGFSPASSGYHSGEPFSPEAEDVSVQNSPRQNYFLPTLTTTEMTGNDVGLRFPATTTTPLPSFPDTFPHICWPNVPPPYSPLVDQFNQVPPITNDAVNWQHHAPVPSQHPSIDEVSSTLPAPALSAGNVPTNTMASPVISSSSPTTSIATVLRNIERWKSEEENKESGRPLEELDEGFLDMVQKDAGKVVSQLLQTPQDHQKVSDFVKKLLVVTQQSRRVVQSGIKTEVRFLLPAHLVAIDKCTLSVTLISAKGEVPGQMKNEYGNIVEAGVQLANSITKSIKLGKNGRFTMTLKPKIPKKLFCIRKKEQPGMNSVLDDKFHLRYVFKATLNALPQKPIMAEAYSFPIKAISNSSQDCSSWATVIWDNAANQFKFDPTPNGDRLPTLKFIDVMNAMNAFLPTLEKKTNQATTGVAPMELKHYEVIFGILKPHLTADGRFNSESGQREISLEEFRSEFDPVPLGLTVNLQTKKKGEKDGEKDSNKKNKKTKENGKEEKVKISFWSWFYHLRKFILEDDQINQAWKSGLIMGYLSPEGTKAELSGCEPGTFIVRLSNTRLDAVTLDWVQAEDDPEHHLTRGVIYQARFDSDMLRQKSLKDRIMESRHFHQVQVSSKSTRSMLPKASMWGGANSTSESQGGPPPKAGYVRTILRLGYNDPPVSVGYVTTILITKLGLN